MKISSIMPHTTFAQLSPAFLRALGELRGEFSALSRPLIAALAAACFVIASCASNNSAPSTPAPQSNDSPVSLSLRNDSTSSLTVQPFEASASGGIRTPLGSPFTVGPNSNVSLRLAEAGKSVSLTIRASGQDTKYLSGEWVVFPRAGAFRLYAFTDDAKTVRLYWNNRAGDEINMQ